MTGGSRTGRRVGADWVVPFDADEVWLRTHGRRSPMCSPSCPRGADREAALYDHVATARTPRRPGRADGLARRDEPLPCEGGLQGASRASRSTRATTAPTTSIPCPRSSGTCSDPPLPLPLAEQMIRKARNGAAAYAATDLPEDVGAHWREYGGSPTSRSTEDLPRRTSVPRGPRSRTAPVYDPCPDRRHRSPGAAAARTASGLGVGARPLRRATPDLEVWRSPARDPRSLGEGARRHALGRNRRSADDRGRRLTPMSGAKASPRRSRPSRTANRGRSPTAASSGSTEEATAQVLAGAAFARSCRCAAALPGHRRRRDLSSLAARAARRSRSTPASRAGDRKTASWAIALWCLLGRPVPVKLRRSSTSTTRPRQRLTRQKGSTESWALKRRYRPPADDPGQMRALSRRHMTLSTLVQPALHHRLHGRRRGTTDSYGNKIRDRDRQSTVCELQQEQRTERPQTTSSPTPAGSNLPAHREPEHGVGPDRQRRDLRVHG